MPLGIPGYKILGVEPDPDAGDSDSVSPTLFDTVEESTGAWGGNLSALPRAPHHLSWAAGICICHAPASAILGKRSPMLRDDRGAARSLWGLGRSSKRSYNKPLVMGIYPRGHGLSDAAGSRQEHLEAQEGRGNGFIMKSLKAGEHPEAGSDRRPREPPGAPGGSIGPSYCSYNNKLTAGGILGPGQPDGPGSRQEPVEVQEGEVCSLIIKGQSWKRVLMLLSRYRGITF